MCFRYLKSRAERLRGEGLIGDGQVESPDRQEDDGLVQVLGPARVLDATGLLERSEQLAALEREFAVVSECSRGHVMLVRGSPRRARTNASVSSASCFAAGTERLVVSRKTVDHHGKHIHVTGSKVQVP